MAVVVHEDGYLQIAEASDMQDISPPGARWKYGSPMWRLIYGLNERRKYCNLQPVSWIDKSVEFVDDGDPFDRPNLQSVRAWQRLQGLCLGSELAFSDRFWPPYEFDGVLHEDDLFDVPSKNSWDGAGTEGLSNFALMYWGAIKNSQFTIAVDTEVVFDRWISPGVLADPETGLAGYPGFMVDGDAIGVHLVNNLFRLLSMYQRVGVGQVGAKWYRDGAGSAYRRVDEGWTCERSVTDFVGRIHQSGEVTKGGHVLVDASSAVVTRDYRRETYMYDVYGGVDYSPTVVLDLSGVPEYNRIDIYIRDGKQIIPETTFSDGEDMSGAFGGSIDSLHKVNIKYGEWESGDSFSVDVDTLNVGFKWNGVPFRDYGSPPCPRLLRVSDLIQVARTRYIAQAAYMVNARWADTPREDEQAVAN